MKVIRDLTEFEPIAAVSEYMVSGVVGDVCAVGAHL